MEQQKVVYLSVTNDLITEQRVHKVATYLVKKNYDVTLIGRLLPHSSELDKRTYKTKRLKILFTSGFLFYVFYNLQLFLFLIFRKVDILVANDTDTLSANYLLSLIKRRTTLIFDAHELFPDVPELENRPFVKNVWQKIEKTCLPAVNKSYTVSNSIAKTYKERYNINMKVVRNIPARNTTDESSIKSEEILKQIKNKKVIIYQGALNKGRGLELLLETALLTPLITYLIIGKGDIEKQLHEKASKQNNKNIIFAGRIKHQYLSKITKECKLGLSLERDIGLNYRYALPNKLFAYIHAEIPVLASDLVEMARIVTKYKIGHITKAEKAEELARDIEKILEIPLDRWKENLHSATEELCWENEEKILDKIFP